MTREDTTPEGCVPGLSNLDLGRLDDFGNAVLRREVAEILPMADDSTQALAGFSARVPAPIRPDTSRGRQDRALVLRARIATTIDGLAADRPREMEWI